MTEEQKLASIRGLFGLIGLAAAVGGGIFAYNESSSWELAIFVGFMALYVLGRAVPDVITDPEKGRRLAFFAIPPVAAVAGLIVAHGLWDEWWLAVLLGFVAGAIGWLIAFSLFPDIAREEQQDSMERASAGGTEGPRRGPPQGPWPVNR